MSGDDSRLKSCSPQRFGQGAPARDWTLDQLSEYARHHNQEILAGERTLAPSFWRLGNALTLARKQFAHGQWECYLESLGITKARSSKACSIFRCFSSAELLKELTVDEAYEARRKGPIQEATMPVNEAAIAAKKFTQSLAKIDKAGQRAIDLGGRLAHEERRELLKRMRHMIGRLQAMHTELERTLAEDGDMCTNIG